MSSDDYYAMLGVSQDASTRQIKAAYRKLAFRHHPDRNRDNPRSSEAMKRINEAYAVLSSPVKRREYDELRRQFGPAAYSRYQSAHSQRDIYNGSDINSVFEEVSHAFGVSVGPVYVWLSEGLMNSARIGERKGDSIRIARASVVQMLEKLKMADDAGKSDPRRK